MSDQRGQRFDARKYYGVRLAELGSGRPECVALTADMARLCGLDAFGAACPGRLLNVGIAEQNMTGVGAGLALEGKIPWISTIAPFMTMRACEQVRTDICYNNLHVVVVGVASGISGAPLGATHYSQEDLAIFRSFPNMKILQPYGRSEQARLMEIAMDLPGPVFLRLGGTNEPLGDDNADAVVFGRARLVRPGVDVSIMATGYMVHKALDAADLLAVEGIAAAVWDHHTVKPLDSEAVLLAAEQSRGIVSVEEHSAIGGLGAAIAQLLAVSRIPTRLEIMGFPDIFMGVGSRDDLLTRYGLDGQGIAERAKHVLDAATGR